MKIKVLLVLTSFMVAMGSKSQNSYQKYEQLPFGSIKPSGWMKHQMQSDLAGFVGNLDRLVPELINDPIYSSGRLGKHSKARELGNLKEGDATGEDQYKWWNSETQSNWWDGYLRNVLLLNDSAGMVKVRNYVIKMIESQDADGYLGIYDSELRYRFQSENGELWSKTTLLRGLLAYYEFTNDQKVWNVILKAVDNVMANYRVNQSNPFYAGKEFTGGVAHGLTFTDICEKMYQITKNQKYLEYAYFLFKNFSQNYSWEKDVQLKSIFDSTYLLQCHGVHTFEHLRPLIVSAYSTGDRELMKALEIYLKRIKSVTTITGGAIGDEWISGRIADATNTGYEYCSLQELLDSYSLLLQKTGDAQTADEIENIFYNAAQGSRNPNHSCIAYLKTDNSYEMMGTKNGEDEPNRKQTRYKYSPVHQDVAVCCVPNAGRISPYFIQNSWMKEDETTLVATLLMPNILSAEINHTKITIKNQTDYPDKNSFNFKIQTDKPVHFVLKIRKPGWVKSIQTKEKYRIENNYIIIERSFNKNDEVALAYGTEATVREIQTGEKYFTYGALVFSKPIEAIEIKGRTYVDEFQDLNYKPVAAVKYSYSANEKITCSNGKIMTTLINQKTNRKEIVELIPIGKTILRQTTFK